MEAEVTESGLAIEVSGEGADAAGAGERHLVVRAMRAAFAAAGGQPPGLALRCANAIPQGRGLGSSAGAVVAGCSPPAPWPAGRTAPARSRSAMMACSPWPPSSRATRTTPPPAWPAG